MPASPNVRRLVPGPREPAPLQMLRFVRDEPGYTAALQRRYGDVFHVRIERRPWVVLADPEHVKQLFTTPPDVVHAGDANEILRPVLGPHSVLVLDEGAHLRQRRLLLPRFHGERLAAWRSEMERVAAEQVRRMPPDRAFSLRPHMTQIALEVILQVVLGTRGAEEHDRLAGGVERLLDYMGRTEALLLPAVAGPDSPLVRRRLAPLLAPLDRDLYRLIAERRTAGDLEEREDVLSLLLLARDEDGTPMSDAELRDELVTLIVAGHETTATALSWAFERLTRDPERLALLEAEAADGASSEYAEAVFREALRLRPVLNNVLRTVAQPVEIGGIAFPPGVVLAPSILLIHRRPELYPEPDAFRPERWLGQTPGTYTWIPFGGGTRRCIGAAFAQLEMEIVLHAIARAVHLEPVGEPERAVPRFITASPQRGGEVRIGRRFEREPALAA